MNQATTSPTTPSRRQTRTRSGCLNCRRRKRKCDEARPTCGTCRRRCQVCEWGVVLTFRNENAQCLDGGHPSMRELGRRARHRPVREFRILDVTAEVIRDYHVEQDDLAGHGADVEGDEEAEEADRPSSHRSADTTTTNVGTNQQRQTESAVENLLYLRQSGHLQTAMPLALSPEDMPPPAFPRQALDDPPCDLSMDMVEDYAYMDHIQGAQVFTPDGVISEDGIFRPGTAYHELHSTLRHHLIQEGRSNAPTRAVTPGQESSIPDGVDMSTAGDSHHSSGTADTAATAITMMSEPVPLLAGPEECDLWRNWFDEVSHWLDKFDRDRHFQTTLPAMARDHGYLRYSILALSARQRELKQTTRPTDRSLALYQEAIHQLLPHLPSRSTAVISTCVILCVLEMVSCSPRDWCRHLDGCASLMQAVGINGFVGGIEQALFWCFVRMDICGGLISSVTTLIPVSHWTGKTTRLADAGISAEIDADVALFHATAAGDGFEHWANYAVYLLGRVMDLITSASTAQATKASSPRPPPSSSSVDLNSPAYRARWLQLWHHVSDWYRDRPPALHPTMTVASTADSRAPFPTILFSNPAGISGNQLHHTASVLLLQNQPVGLRLSVPGRPKPRGILWHARQICGIGISNHHHGAWTNAIQPLWIAGRCMSHPSEHRAILDLLERIERESGWGTRTRADDLREFWGDLDD